MLKWRVAWYYLSSDITLMGLWAGKASAIILRCHFFARSQTPLSNLFFTRRSIPTGATLGRVYFHRVQYVQSHGTSFFRLRFFCFNMSLSRIQSLFVKPEPREVDISQLHQSNTSLGTFNVKMEATDAAARVVSLS